MARTTSGQYQADAEGYISGTLGMTAYPSDFESVSQALVPATEYFSILVSQAGVDRAQDGNVGLVELSIILRLLYRFVTNEAEYTGSGDTPTKLKAALAVFMDEQFWRGAGGSFTLTSPLSVHEITAPEITNQTRTGRVIETEITVALTTTSV